MEIYATSAINNARIQYAASVTADLLDNDNDGIVDDPALCHRLMETGVITPIFQNDDDPAMDDLFDVYDLDIAVLFRNEVKPTVQHPGYMGDATVEEIVHNINCKIKT